MAMIKCNECGKEMSDLAEKCPSCGCPNRPKKVCPECNESMDSSATVCQKCGYVFKTTVSGNGSVNQGAKSKIAAGILGIFLGAFGVHNFYLGYNGKAVGQLLITLLSCFILSPISSIWGLVEGILILTGSINVDADGMPLTD